MPYYTEIPDGVITVGADLGIALVDDTQLLNAFGTSQEFSQYDVDANGATTLSNGDNVSLVDADGTSLTGAGTYVGSATFATAATTVGISGLASIGLQVNELEGSIMEANGTYYFISDEPVDDGHINVTASITVAGFPVSVTGPISDITDLLADAVADLPLGVGTVASGLIRGAEGLIQTTANAVATTLDNDTTDDLALSDAEVFCFVAGTMIETRNGQIAVENLRVGDEVLTRDRGFQEIRWIGSVKIPAATLTRQPKLRPIRIKAGAIGADMPSSDLLVSPQHRIFVRSKIAVKMFGALEVLVPAKQLLQLEGVDYAEDLETVEYFHFLFDQHEIVMSNGAATESLFTGPQALKAVGHAGRAELLALFPQLADPEFSPEPVRAIASGRQSRRLAIRHTDKHRALVS
ncbi:Hint domain-containing protein [Paracoccus sp. CPCC 101403]|uniref:Hint domain-containing protein n=1 Tax=Paracoccus broussonetiae TaxID=3075834 RepID=A0ABU3ECG7_9RHOB|nr:Hint domain-containing protein [Paracoccus sp. CPCC 101403]MDT1061920.1 Hint domain-containing protein [Paracoccus sp. CPCC 101403]